MSGDCNKRVLTSFSSRSPLGKVVNGQFSNVGV